MDKISWLKSETKFWIEENIISEEQGEKINALYKKNNISLFFVFSIIGAVLISLGIILVFANNWRYIPKIYKTIISFLPLLAASFFGGYTILKNHSSKTFREVSGIFITLSIFATMALISQTFHKSGELSVFIMICFLMSVPVLYIFDSLSCYIILNLAYVVGFFSRNTEINFAIIIFLVVPYIIKYLRNDENKSVIDIITLYSSLSFVFLITNIFLRRFEFLDNTLSLVEVIVLSYLILELLAKNLLKNKTNTFYLYSSVLASIVLYFVGSFRDLYYYDMESNFIKVLLLMAVLIILYMIIHYKYEKKFITEDIFFITSIIFVVVIKYFPLIAKFSFLAIGIYFIYFGYKEVGLGKLNFGLVFTIAVILLIFISEEFSILARGIAFIVLGILFFIINLIMINKRKGIRG